MAIYCFVNWKSKLWSNTKKHLIVLRHPPWATKPPTQAYSWPSLLGPRGRGGEWAEPLRRIRVQPGNISAGRDPGPRSERALFWTPGSEAQPSRSRGRRSGQRNEFSQFSAIFIWKKQVGKFSLLACPDSWYKRLFCLHLEGQKSSTWGARLK